MMKLFHKLIASGVRVEPDAGKKMFNVRIVPDGHVVSKAGDFFVDQEAFRLIFAEFQAHGTQVVIDYEHQTLGDEFASPDGIAPASGWIKALFYKPGEGIFARVEWTDRATTMIRSKEYKYLSPVLLIRDEDGKAVQLISAGLTNKPAIEHMDVLAAKDHLSKEKIAMEEPTSVAPVEEMPVVDSPEMILGAIMQELGISLESSDIVDGLKAVLEKVTKADIGDDDAEKSDAGDGAAEEVANKMRTALSLKESATADELLVAVNSLKRAAGGSGDTFKKLAELQEQLAELSADKVLEPYLAANKINPNDREDMTVCRALAKSDPKALAHQMKFRAAYAAPGKSAAPDGTASGGGKKSRETIIAHAAREYDTDGDEGRITSRDNFVNSALIQAKRSVLSKEEREKIVV